MSKNSAWYSTIEYQTDRHLKSIWRGMKHRCYNIDPSKEQAKYYRNKGIKICDEWLDSYEAFKEWSLAHGYEIGLCIDRIDSDKNYCPENCQWITRSENSRKAGILTGQRHPKRGLFNVARYINGEFVWRFYIDENGNKQRNF